MLRHNLNLAGEVQRSLLPPPCQNLRGIELAGRSMSCTGVGGDYFDYLHGPDFIEDRLRVIIGDVSGHGIDAALLMSSARTYLRTRSSLPGKPSAVINQMNQQFDRDICSSGHFMTLFCLDIDLVTGEADWVRAGHDPPILYDPDMSIFKELRGYGLPVGVDSSFRYRDHRCSCLKPGTVIALGTDGIWEAQNSDNIFFGKDSFIKTIKNHASRSAREIVDTVFAELEDYCKDVPIHDDITLVIIKITSEFKTRQPYHFDTF